MLRSGLMLGVFLFLVGSLAGCRQQNALADPALGEVAVQTAAARALEQIKPGRFPRAELGLSGKVVDVRCGTTIAITCGAAAGVREGDVFEIRRGGEKLGRAAAVTVWCDFAGLKPLDAMRWTAGDDAVLVQLAAQTVMGGDGAAKTPLADLASEDPEVQTAAVERVVEERRSAIRSLCEVISASGQAAGQDHRRARAVYLLGTLRAPEAVSALVAVVHVDFVGPLKRRPHGIMNPSEALILIGRPAVPQLLTVCKSTDDERMRRTALGVLGNILGGKRRLDTVLARLSKATTDKTELARLESARTLIAEWREDKEPLY